MLGSARLALAAYHQSVQTTGISAATAQYVANVLAGAPECASCQDNGAPEVYDPRTNRWKTIGDPDGRYYPGDSASLPQYPTDAVTLGGPHDKLMIIARSYSGGQGSRMGVYLYDPAHHSVQTRSSIPIALPAVGDSYGGDLRMPRALLLPNGHVFVLANYGEALEYNPASDHWSVDPPMQPPATPPYFFPQPVIGGYAMALLHDGQVMVVGGYAYGGQPVAQAQIYTPKS